MSEPAAVDHDGKSPIDVSALVVNYNSTRLAFEMLETLAEQEAVHPDGRPLAVEFVLVDNASPQLRAGDPEQVEYLERIRRFAEEVLPGKVVLHDRNDGYAGGMNLAFEHARGEHLLVLNPDQSFLPGCLQALHRHMLEHPRTGAAGPIGYWDKGREVRLPPNILPTIGDLFYGTLAQVFPRFNRRYIGRRFRAALPYYLDEGDVRLDMLSGACLMMRRSDLERTGGFFDDRFPLYYEDTDLFRRIRAAGLELVAVRGAEIAHYYNRSGTTDPGEAMDRYWRAKRIYYKKYYGWWGVLLESLSRRFLRSGMAGRSREKLGLKVVDLGDASEPPTLELGRHCEHFVLEMCQDPAFLLAAGVLGSGDRWTPGESFWYAFGNSEYYFRCMDVSGGRSEELVVYRFRRVDHPDFPAISREAS